MNITDLARDVVKQVFTEKSADNIRVFFNGMG